MKKYYNPEIIVEIIETEDILTTSPVGLGDNTTRYGFGSFTEEI